MNIEKSVYMALFLVEKIKKGGSKFEYIYGFCHRIIIGKWY